MQFTILVATFIALAFAAPVPSPVADALEPRQTATTGSSGSGLLGIGVIGGSSAGSAAGDSASSSSSECSKT